MKTDIEKNLLNLWDRQFQNNLKPDHFEYLLKSGFRKDLLFIFTNHHPNPICIGYFTSEEKVIPRLKIQFEILSELKKSQSNLIKASVPEPFIWKKLDNKWFLCLGIVPGKPLGTYLDNPSLKNTYIHTTTNWLKEIHTLYETNRPSLAEYMTSKNYCTELVELLKPHKNETIPLVLKQGDFHPSNVLFDQNQIYVIDWEYSSFEGTALYDLFYFLIHIYRRNLVAGKRIGSVYKNSQPSGENINIPTYNDFKEVFFKGGAVYEETKELIYNFCTSVTLDSKMAKLLFYLFLNHYMGEEFLKKLIKHHKDLL